MVNTQMRWEEIECTFRVKGKQPEIWMTDDASVRKIMLCLSSTNGTTCACQASIEAPYRSAEFTVNAH
ncbi:MAG: hypothetical protein GY809_20165 [Planctomycetes bacterium]|nr:hypothetical protein [Planctomycetota bacterium]